MFKAEIAKSTAIPLLTLGVVVVKINPNMLLPQNNDIWKKELFCYLGKKLKETFMLCETDT